MDRRGWIFGYGSLVWRPDFPYLDKQPAHIRGWKRRFWQGSTDHRGVPQAPGRVVTLIRSEAPASCWGMAYAIDRATAGEIVRALDYRERGGYARHEVQIHLRDRPKVAGTVYIATPQNGNYLGPADPNEIAAQIVRSAGPSGRNVDYLFALAESMRAFAVIDRHVFDLEQRVRALISCR